MINKKLAENRMQSRQDLEDAFLEMLSPYLSRLSPGGALVDPGTPAATFSERAAGMEGFSRLLWGIVPFIKGTKDKKKAGELAGIAVRGISCGVDPGHPEFWGVPAAYDQLLVEMAALAYALLMAPEQIWEPLSAKDKDNLSGWLLYMNKRDIPDCNWIFFRVLVNCALIKLGRIDPGPDILDKSLKTADAFYLDDGGWYNDGYSDKRRARGYYIPWAMHFYGLVFSAFCADLYPGYAAKYAERAIEFSSEFAQWFADDGSALPFGRSLTYRFAQSAFWSILPVAVNKGADWGMAGRIFRDNMRWWFAQPVFDDSGLLSIGYRYPNQYMAERYNSANSPLWAFKAFAALALQDDHPFWKDESKSGGLPDETVQTGSGMYICRGKKAGHHYALNAGQWTPGISNEHLHMAEKYGKFAYSNSFGFNVVSDAYGIDKLAADNMLLLGDDDSGHYRFRRESHDHEICAEYLFSRWNAYDDVEVATWLIPLRQGRWHARIHLINSGRRLVSAEGGFPLAFGNDHYPLPDTDSTMQEYLADAVTKSGRSRIADLSQCRKGYVIPASPNANIMFPRTVVPVLKGEHEVGTVLLASAVCAGPDPVADSAVPKIQDFIKVLPKQIQTLITE